jgi:hypothetical protein
MADSPSMRRALEMAASVAPAQPAELSYPPDAQLTWKSGAGAMLAVGSPQMGPGTARGAGGGVATVGAGTPAGRVWGGVVVGATGTAGTGTVVDGGGSVVDVGADTTLRRSFGALWFGELMVASTAAYMTTAAITITTITSNGAMRERLVGVASMPDEARGAVDREKRGARGLSP